MSNKNIFQQNMKTEIASIFSNVLLPLKHHFSQKTNCDENILKRHTAFLWDISHKVHERRLIPSFLTGAFYNFLLLSFQIKVNIKRKILELLSACGKMKKEKAQLSRFWQHNQWIKHSFCLTSTYQSWSAVWSPVGYAQKYTNYNLPTETVQILYLWISITNE